MGIVELYPFEKYSLLGYDAKDEAIYLEPKFIVMSNKIIRSYEDEYIYVRPVKIKSFNEVSYLGKYAYLIDKKTQNDNGIYWPCSDMNSLLKYARQCLENSCKHISVIQFCDPEISQEIIKTIEINLGSYRDNWETTCALFEQYFEWYDSARFDNPQRLEEQAVDGQLTMFVFTNDELSGVDEYIKRYY